MRTVTNDANINQAWRHDLFGIALRAFMHLRGGPQRFFSELSTGDIEAIALTAPPKTDDPLLNAAGIPDPAWWTNYWNATLAKADTRGIKLTSVWSTWFHSDVAVDSASTIRLLAQLLDEERAMAAEGKPEDLAPPSTWSDLEALAWIASRDEGLRKGVRDFVRHDSRGDRAWRERALLYLAFHVSWRHCSCRAPSNPILILDRPAACACLKTAWVGLIAALQRGELSAEQQINSRTVPARKNRFRAGCFDARIRQFSLIKGPGDVLLDGAEVSLKFKIEGTGRYTDEEIQYFIASARTENSKEAWNDFKTSPRAKGCYKKFHFFWAEMRPRGRGRPRKRI